MKQQYFGDAKDVFKFDLLGKLCIKLKLDGITYIPMLTPQSSTDKDGEDRTYDKNSGGCKNDKLIAFCEQFKSEKSKRNIFEISKYFKSVEIPFNCANSEECFSYKGKLN
ncbi:hypothetical protein EZS27_024629 [termite gut metagenome]|uniref:Uncharacterized protein n=1 Tax=termite gut metagenome TaxID=433724 RepID=A0A5J4QXD7_9ZZZZ